MGTRVLITRPRHTFKDHPHAYGDKIFSMKLETPLIGSSPRVWGQACVCPPARWAVGIIPTRMGTSLSMLFQNFLHRDHPHAYGDKPVRIFEQSAYQGSSPRVWGQEDDYRRLLSCRGIIPTRMGTRSTYTRHRNPLRDHPHAYGDKRQIACEKINKMGSSPRVWGQDPTAIIAQKACRIIPTRMGTSPKTFLYCSIP